MVTALSFATFLIIGIPVAFILGLVTLVFVLETGDFTILMSMPSRLFNGLQNFGLVAIPLFVLLGEIMNKGGITKRLIDCCQTIFGGVKGGLAYVNVLANMALSSILGSANAQTAIMSKTLVPYMEKEGYDRNFSASLTAASSIVGPLIPPSMPFIIYGVTAGVSIGSLFLAGILPGILFGIAFSILIFVITKKKQLPATEKSNFKSTVKIVLKVLPALCIPVIILVGISTGIFTATESAAVSVIIALIVGAFLYKELKFKDMEGILKNTLITSAAVTFLLATSSIFGWVLNIQRIPQALADIFLTITENPLVFLLLINILLLVIGMFIDGLAALILLTPILLPIAVQFGIDPIHFGVIFVVNMTLGLMTPPVGSILFITSSLSNVKLEHLIRSMLPFFVVSFIVLMIITYIPWFSTAIPTYFTK